MASKPHVAETSVASFGQGTEPSFAGERACATGERELRDLVARMASQQAQLGSQLNATMAALGTLTTAVARQNATISSLMDEVRRLREQGAPPARRAAH